LDKEHECLKTHLEIQNFAQEHIEDALQIYNYYIENSTATFSIEPIGPNAMEKLAFSGLERFPAFVLLVEGKVVGYSLLNRYKPREAYDKTAEVTIYIAQEHLKKGYGQQALEHLINQAKRHDFHALLAVICQENTGSLRLFEKNGFFQCAHFKEVGEKFNRVLDVVVYERILS